MPEDGTDPHRCPFGDLLCGGYHDSLFDQFKQSGADRLTATLTAPATSVRLGVLCFSHAISDRAGRDSDALSWRLLGQAVENTLA